VFTGQPVEVKFQTFSFTEFGNGLGTVRLVSSDSFLTNTTSTTTSPSSSGTAPNSVYTGQAPNSAYFYDVRVTLDRLSLRHIPKDTHIVPGMPVEADIKVGQRTLLEYLSERVLPVVQEGMREPN
jgi:HlyD family secretion protein